MGHMRLGVLPTSKKWDQVVAALGAGAATDEIASVTTMAAESSLKRASDDPAFLHAFWLLTQIPLAARSPDFVDELVKLGLRVDEAPLLMDVTGALSAAVDEHILRSGARTDLGEMAQMAAAESLFALVSPNLPSLFGPTPSEVQRQIGRCASGDRFSKLAREFFTRLMVRVLQYYLSRELANHTGAGHRFSSDGERATFSQALESHARETALIIENFAGGWYGKNVYREGGLTEEKVKKFAPVAFRKLRSELRKRRDAEG